MVLEQVFGQDLDEVERLSTIVESGMVSVNNVVISDPRVPFGGVKKSGLEESCQDTVH